MPEVVNRFQVRLGGEAGQGVESGGAGFARAVMRAGLHCFGLQDYMSRIRGGHNFYQIRVSEDPLYTFDDSLHLLLAFNKETADLHWHDLRHEGACRLLADGVDIRTIQLMLGHADIKQTQRYLNITDEELRKAMTGVWERRRRLRAVGQ